MCRTLGMRISLFLERFHGQSLAEPLVSWLPEGSYVEDAFYQIEQYEIYYITCVTP